MCSTARTSRSKSIPIPITHVATSQLIEPALKAARLAAFVSRRAAAPCAVLAVWWPTYEPTATVPSKYRSMAATT